VQVVINVDGGSRGNPGPAGAGIVIAAADDGTILHKAGVFIGQATNNVAEYTGLIEGLKRAAKLQATDVKVLSDSELMVRQMTGQYRVKNQGLKPLYEEATQLAGQLSKFSIAHVRREQNEAADALANKAMNLKRTFED